MAMCYMLLHPASRGSIHITSAIDVYAPPNLDAGFVSHPADIPLLIWAYKKIHEIVRRMPSFIREVGGLQLSDETPGGDRGHPFYSKEDDALVEKRMRERIQTCYHPMLVPLSFRSLSVDG